jgi:hypothetical protein
MFATVGFVLLGVSTAYGQAADTPFQVRPVTNLKGKDAIVVTNSGASSTVPLPQNGNLCANVYAFGVDGALLNCCSCLVRPDTPVSIGVLADVLENPKPKPKSTVLKVMASTGTMGACNAGTVGTGANALATGLVPWLRENPFTPSTLSAAELSSLNTRCLTLHPQPNTCVVCRQ